MTKIDYQMLREFWGDEDFTESFAESVFEWRNTRPVARQDRKARCAECPVKDGMYAPFAELLKLLPVHRQEYHLARWWCHTDTRFCCNGAREHVRRTGKVVWS